MDRVCKGCQTVITEYIGTWWDASEDCACPNGGEHFPMLVTHLPAQEAYNTWTPKAKYRETGGRIVPANRTKPIKQRRIS